MSALGSLWSRWVAATSRREGGETAAAFRVLVGIAVIATVLGAYASGAWEFAWIDRIDGGYRTMKATWLVDLLGGPRLRVVRLLMTLAVASGGLLVLGLGGRWTALLALQSYLPLTRLNTHTGGAYEHLLTNALWLLVLIGPTATHSLDCMLRTGRWTSEERSTPVWGRWLILTQLILVYSSTGLQKLGSGWTPFGGFSAVYYALRDPMWARWDLPWLGWMGPLLAVGTACVWMFESGWVLAPLWFWLRRREPRGGRLERLARRWDLRPAILAFGLAMHGGIFALMDVATFSWITLSFYVALWTPEQWRRGLSRVGRGPRPQGRPDGGAPIPAGG